MSSRTAPNSESSEGFATAEGTRRYAERLRSRAAAGHFREVKGAGGLVLSSIGIGTYLGEPDEATDRSYAGAVVAAVEGGINVVDTAINYRFQRSERSIGAALEELFAAGFARDEVVLCTKAGFLTPDGEMPQDANEYFYREFVERGIFRPEEVAAGCHCLAPNYLANQLDRSLRNLGVACVDVFYLHNPETQLGEIPRKDFLERVRAAFTWLESAVSESKIRSYGLATWNSFRNDPAAGDFLSLEEMIEAARQAAGADHHFRFVQLPFSLAMPEALIRPNQMVRGKTMPMMQAAQALGITLVASAPLLQGQLARNLPPFVVAAIGLRSDLERALQFARSAPGITTALVGMSRAEHVRSNLALVSVEPASREDLLKLFSQKV